MNSILLHTYGWWVVEFLTSIIDAINGVREESGFLKILLWPVVYGVTVLRVIARCLAHASWAFPHQVVPDTWRNTWQHFMSKTPMSVYCFNKTGFAILLTEVILFYYSAWIFMARPLFILPYTFLKIALSLVPFIELSPVQRLPFWLLCLLFSAVEIWCGIKLIRCWGYGIDFYHGHFYNHWEKWYRYRHITSNRIIGTECCRYGYLGAKLAVLNDMICSNKEVIAARLNSPYAATHGEVLTAQELESWFGELNYGPCTDFSTFTFCAACLLMLLSSTPRALPARAAGTAKGLTSTTLRVILSAPAALAQDITLLQLNAADNNSKNMNLFPIVTIAPSFPLMNLWESTNTPLPFLSPFPFLELLIYTFAISATLLLSITVLVDRTAAPLTVRFTPVHAPTRFAYVKAFLIQRAIDIRLKLTDSSYSTIVRAVGFPVGASGDVATLLHWAPTLVLLYTITVITVVLYARQIAGTVTKNLAIEAQVAANFSLWLCIILVSYELYFGTLLVSPFAHPEYALVVKMQVVMFCGVALYSSETLTCTFSRNVLIAAALLTAPLNGFLVGTLVVLGYILLLLELTEGDDTRQNMSLFPLILPAPFTDEHNGIRVLIEQYDVANSEYGVLFLLALSSLGVYSIILASWSSNSKYAPTRFAYVKALLTQRAIDIRLKLTDVNCSVTARAISIPPVVLDFAADHPTLTKIGTVAAGVLLAKSVHYVGTRAAEYAAHKTYNWMNPPTTPSNKSKSSFVDDYDFINMLTEQDSVASLKYGVLFLLALSSLGVYSIILAGWSSNSKYAFMGALRSAAQMISYEVAISLIILPVVTFSGSLDLTMITYVQHITSWLCWPLLPIALLFLIAMLAETNRTPFDLPEAEAELVAGYNVDYSSLPFAMFFLGEYCNMLLISTLFCLLFLSGGLNSIGIASAIMLSLKASVAWIFFVLVRATLPRYRYDQLMDIGWKVFLPTSGSFLLFAFGILVFFIALPVANELPLFSQ